MDKKRTVVIGLIGTLLDSGTSPDRWNRWRPTVGSCRQEDLVVDRRELLADRRYKKLGEKLSEDLAAVSPETEVRHHEVPMPAPWDFEAVYDAPAIAAELRGGAR